MNIQVKVDGVTRTSFRRPRPASSTGLSFKCVSCRNGVWDSTTCIFRTEPITPRLRHSSQSLHHAIIAVTAAASARTRTATDGRTT